VSEAWIALGSNLGRREGYLARAVERLAQEGFAARQISHLYETRPQGTAGEPDYLNAVLRGTTDLSPEELLRRMLRIEAELGRPAAERAGPRTCDLDLLAYDAEVRDGEAGLCLPHPRLHQRGFVLVPLCELDVHWRHPLLGRTAGEMLAALPGSPGDVRLHGPLPVPQPAALDRS